MQHFTSIYDVTDLEGLVQQAIAFKQQPLAHLELGRNKTIGLLFFNPSLRTRLSTQRAATNLGMNTMVMDIGKDGWQLEFQDGAVMNGNTAEHIREAAAVVSQYCEIIGIRTFPSLQNRQQDDAEQVLGQFVRFATSPIVSLESATRHPLQSLADLITIRQHQRTPRPKVVLTWAPHPRVLPQAVANSFVEWMRAVDVNLVIAHPKGYELAPAFVGNATVTNDQDEALAGADFVYAKNWSSYHAYGQILSQDPSWMLTPEKMNLTNDAFFMHCLPVRRNVVVADAVLDSNRSLVIEQANNRTFAAQAVLKTLLETTA